MSARALQQAAGRQRGLVDALARQQGGTVIETAISLVLLTGDHAYKFKKPMRTDWLDYGTPGARLRCCEEEVRLNRRLAPHLYLGVAALTGSPRWPSLNGTGPVLDYAVHMRRFDQRALWTWRLAHGVLGKAELHRFGTTLADFHAAAARADVAAPWAGSRGGAATVAARTAADLAEVRALLDPAAPAQTTLAALAAWLARRGAEQAGRFDRRLRQGWVRECHGDLHCNNILTLDGQVLGFDGIEFNPALRWIDVQQDLAFVLMDLRYRGRPDLAARLLDSYLARGGDYQGVVLLPYFCCQRALVRAKVVLLESRNLALAHRDALYSEAARLLAWALSATAPADRVLLATHGLAGSGKSMLCESLVEPLAAVRLRSDVERKRLHGIDRHQPAGAAPGAGIYVPRVGRRTYGLLLRLACDLSAAGLVVLLDAAFLYRWQRRALARTARRIGARWFLLDVRAAPALLAARLQARTQGAPQASDAGVEVLAYQRQAQDPLQPDERAQALEVATGETWTEARALALTSLIRIRLAALPGGGV